MYCVIVVMKIALKDVKINALKTLIRQGEIIIEYKKDVIKESNEIIARTKETNLLFQRELDELIVDNNHD